MRKKLYKLFIEPRQKDEDLRNREIVLNVLLAGTVGVFLLAFVMLVMSYLAGFTYVSGRILGVGVGVVFILSIYQLARSARYRLAANLLLLVYLAITSLVAYTWGVTMPVAVMLYGLIVVLAGILLGAKYSMYAAIATGAAALALATVESNGYTRVDLTWSLSPLDIGITLGVCLILGVVGLVTWLFNVQLERSLHRAHRAEAGLRRQKLLLETKVEQRTRQLQAAQFERVQQLYRFAELGQLSTALLHDLANHLTTLTLDIEGLEEQSSSAVLKRAKRSIRYIDDMVLKVRDQLQGKQHNTQFNVANEVEAVVHILGGKAEKAGVTLEWKASTERKALRCRGEPIRFRQLMANLVSNAIDAYEEDSPSPRLVEIRASAAKQDIVITVTDQGRGISAEDRNKLFEPFFSTKKTGMGLGLFIAKQLVEEGFGGKIGLDPTQDETTFRVRIPRV